ncbi:aryl-alcohol oxidase [Desarmillaria tabescens]|uniref:Aryl-alcohol oxidase n=1 Tax=Armillaria tabescens TaxID=1929756 RepID=A0AA39NIH8_ARMTA|nr:aryl-alcohol oxidase [Desarmillaria tabescens]KAK0466266.1 aryl-alcohol oxidase [Desarmillaria tabescens]
MRLSLIVLYSLLLSALSCYGAIYQDAAELPGTEFDFLVVGGGAAGAVVANRLTEEDFSVLVLEAGPSDHSVLSIEIPWLVGLLGNTPYDWNYTTVVQPGFNNKAIAFPRGHVLGGSTSINSMIYTRASPEDYDRYANFTGDQGWSWENLKPYVFKNERWTPPADSHNTTGQYDPAIHSLDGMNAVSLAGYPHPTDKRVLRTTSEFPDEFPLLLDVNSGVPHGIGYMQATIDGGRRSSSAVSYLGPEFINRTNLHVLLNAQVTRILRSNRAELNFDVVEFSAFSEGSTRLFNVTAVKEIILSAGTIGTPHILLNSGIGDAAELSEAGVQVVVDLPDVGKNLSDQPKFWNKWYVDTTNTWDDILRNLTYRNEFVAQWNETQMGPLVDTLQSHIMWSRLPNDSPIFERFADPAAGLNTPHIELGIQNGWGLPATTIPESGYFMSIATCVVSPTSRGSVKLNSSDPLGPPLIDPGYLSSEFDVFTLVEAVKSALRFVSASAWNDYVLEPYGELAQATTDEALEQYVRNNAGSAAHPVGTASMSPKSADYGVVDPDLLVKGVSGLRVVDASIFPFVPAGHTQVPTYIIAERAADFIKSKWTQQRNL